jgi:pre-mRNA-processing factor 19
LGVTVEMYCAISGVSPEEPVVSRKSGHIFERRLLLKALATSGGKCPITGEDLSEDDLVIIQRAGKLMEPVPASAAALPGLLAHMQSEWDSKVLETHSLRQALAEAHQELAAALYKYDAATRVIARVIKERDEARAGLANRDATMAAASPAVSSKVPEIVADPAPASSVAVPVNGDPGADVMKGVTAAAVSDQEGEAAEGNDPDVVPIPEGFLQCIVDKHEELTKARLARKNRKSAQLASAGDVRDFEQTHSVEIVQGDANCTAHAIQMVPIVGSESSESVAVACSDGAIRMYNAEDLSPQGFGAPSAHAGAVTCLASDRVALPKLLFSGGSDGIVRGWDIEALQAKSNGNGDVAPTGTEGRRSGERPRRRRQSSAASAIPDPVVPIIELAGEEGNPSPVTGLSVHPCGKIVLSSLENGKWRLHDTNSGVLVGAGRGSQDVDCCTLHPDGVIFAIGLKSGAVEMWDVNQMKESSGPVATLGGAAVVKGSARAIRMSENGYVMVVGGGGFVRVWDLRVLKMTREARVCKEDRSAETCGVALDWSGTFCAASTGSGLVRLFETRKLKHLVDAGEDSDSIDRPGDLIGVAWGEDALCAFASGGNGRIARISKATGVI